MKEDPFQYANATDCGDCKYFAPDAGTCDYYYKTGMHRNEDDPPRYCSVHHRSRKRKHDYSVDSPSSAPLVRHETDVPHGFYSSRDIALVFGCSSNTAARFITEIGFSPFYRVGYSHRSSPYYSLEQCLALARVMLKFHSPVTGPLPDRPSDLRAEVQKQINQS